MSRTLSSTSSKATQQTKFHAIEQVVLLIAMASSSSFSTCTLRSAMSAPKAMKCYKDFIFNYSSLFKRLPHSKLIAGSADLTQSRVLSNPKSINWEQNCRNRVRCQALEVENNPLFLVGNKFQLDDVIEAQQFDRDILSAIFEVAREMEKIEKNSPGSQILKGFLMATLFYEPSTRTRLSFESAMKRLGGEVLTTENAHEFSSAAKGETLEDTLRTVEGYSDIIVMRHFESGAARRAAATASIPVINAGDGPGQHPTQTSEERSLHSDGSVKASTNWLVKDKMCSIIKF